MKSNRAQEEMVGFGLIIIIVAVILLVFISISVRDNSKEVVENYEVDSFIQSFLQYTSDCGDYRENYDIQNLIKKCDKETKCVDGRNTCEVLKEEITNLLEESWRVGEDYPYKGYNLLIGVESEGKILLNITEGNVTNNYKNAWQDIPSSGKIINIKFSSYY